MNEDFDVEVARRLIFYAIIVGLIAAGFAYGVGSCRSTMNRLEHEADVESHQYIEARKSEVLSYMEEYDELEAEIAKYEDLGKHNIASGLRAQQKSLARKIRAALEKLPQEEHPAGSRKFLR